MDLKPGDVVLSALVAREKGISHSYYSCEAVALIEGGVPYGSSGQPITSAVAIYQPSASAAGRPRELLERGRPGPEEKKRLQAELARLYGPGELVSGFACPGEMACRLLRSKPLSLN